MSDAPEQTPKAKELGEGGGGEVRVSVAEQGQAGEAGGSAARRGEGAGKAGGAGGELTIQIEGSLTSATLPRAWPAALEPLRRLRPRRVIIDASKLVYCDDAGVALFVEMRRVLAAGGGEMSFTGLKPDLKALVDMSALPDPAAPQLRPPAREGFVTGVGQSTADVLAEVKSMVAFLGEVCVALVWAIFHPRQLRWGDLLAVAEKVGADALPVICLLGFLIGVILAFQSAIPMERFGVRDVIPTMVSIAVVRELGPLIATLLLAGRTGSSFAAELGTMKVTEEVNALRAMGLDPVRFLVVPRVLAAMATAPLLSVFSSLAGVIGGYSVMANYGFSFLRYVRQVRGAVTYHDLLGGVAKTVVFAFIVGGVGCLRGLRTANGPGAVGDSTTRAVVTSIVLIIATDGLFGVVYYYLGI